MKDAAPVTPVHSLPHSRSPSRSRVLGEDGGPAPSIYRRWSRRRQARGIEAGPRQAHIGGVLGHARNRRPKTQNSNVSSGSLILCSATHVTPRRGLVLVAVARARREMSPPAENINIKDFGQSSGTRGAGTSPAVRHIRAATRESLSVRWGWEGRPRRPRPGPSPSPCRGRRAVRASRRPTATARASGPTSSAACCWPTTPCPSRRRRPWTRARL